MRLLPRPLRLPGPILAPLVARARALAHQLVARYQAADGYLKFATTTLLLAGVVFLVLPPVLRLFYPTAGGFDQGTLNALALGALENFAAAHLALFIYRRLLPTFYDHLVAGVQDRALENVTGELEAQLRHPETLTSGLLPLLAEQRKLLQLKFSIRCKRLLFCLLPLAFLYIGALYVLTAALTIVPH